MSYGYYGDLESHSYLILGYDHPPLNLVIATANKNITFPCHLMAHLVGVSDALGLGSARETKKMGEKSVSDSVC
jgi:hypothetical protein